MDQEPQQRSILTAVQIAAAKEIIEIEVARYLDYLPTQIEKILYQTTLSVLGLRETRGTLRFEKSEEHWLEDIFRNAVVNCINDQVSVYINKTVRQAMSDDGIILDIKRDIYKIYKEKMTTKLRIAMEERANEDAKNCVRALANSLTFNTNQDPADPESFQGPVGEIILRQLAKNIVDEDDHHNTISFDGKTFVSAEDEEIPF